MEKKIQRILHFDWIKAQGDLVACLIPCRWSPMVQPRGVQISAGYSDIILVSKQNDFRIKKSPLPFTFSLRSPNGYELYWTSL